MNERERLLDVIVNFKNLCVGFATGTKTSYEDYEKGRDTILSEPSLHGIIPKWIILHRYGSQFWSFISTKFSTYKDRRNFLLSSFEELINSTKNEGCQPIEFSLYKILGKVNCDNIETIWKKIYSRREDDPEGAITATKTVLESTLKYILEELGKKYTDADDLPTLYRNVSNELHLSPGRHNDKIFKQILQGISSVIIGFSSLRNKYGDAHGKGNTYAKPERRHAELAINLSGAMCVFLLETLSVQKRT